MECIGWRTSELGRNCTHYFQKALNSNDEGTFCFVINTTFFCALVKVSKSFSTRK